MRAKALGLGGRSHGEMLLEAHGLIVWITHRQAQFFFLSITGSPVQAGPSYIDHKLRQPIADVTTG